MKQVQIQRTYRNNYNYKIPLDKLEIQNQSFQFEEDIVHRNATNASISSKFVKIHRINIFFCSLRNIVQFVIPL